MRLRRATLNGVFIYTSLVMQYYQEYLTSSHSVVKLHLINCILLLNYSLFISFKLLFNK